MKTEILIGVLVLIILANCGVFFMAQEKKPTCANCTSQSFEVVDGRMVELK